MNVLFLYSHLMPYTIEGIKSLIKMTGVTVHIVHYTVSQNAPYQLPEVENIIYYSKDNFKKNNIIKLIGKIQPRFIFITGWSNRDYINTARYVRKIDIPVITGCDTQWRNDIRQKIAVLFSKLLVRRYFNYMMVSGYYQYEYARLLGFQRSNILYPLYAANISLFNSKYKEFLPIKKLTYPRNILFVGRFEKEKNIPLLIESFQSIKDKKGWQLTLIGNGSLNSKIVDQSKNDPNIIIKDFMQPEKLVEEIKNAGVFCLPSDYEPWGVVIQEFAAAGLPLITSNVCGASSIFLKESYNGYIFNKKDIKGLKDALLRILDKRDHELLLFSERSHRLAQIINPEMYAANFIQFLQ